jgi:hypothetical protein
MTKKILFLHGLESLPGGTKAQHLEAAGYDVLNPALPKNNFEESVAIAQEEIDLESPDVIVGSSRGGAIAMAVNPRGAKLVLVAPAWKHFDVDPASLPRGTTVLHCPSDSIVHYEDSQALESAGINLVSCGVDHRMNDVEALENLLASI